MKHLIQRQILPLFLCIALLLGLAACGGQDGQSTGDEGSGTAGTLSGTKEEKDDTTGVPSGSEEGTAGADPESAEEALNLLYDAMAWEDQYAGATAYLGYREQGDSAPLSDWLREKCAGLIEEAPFLLNIPDERVFGAGCGDLFCIIPRDEATTLTVNHVIWVPSQHEVGPVTNEVLYQAKSAQPVLIFVNVVHPASPDIHITLETDDGQICTWLPLVDEYCIPQIPGAPEAPFLMDFAVWEPHGPVRWAPPSEWELAYTNWACEHWDIEISWGDSGDPEYAGIVNLYHQPEDGQVYALLYTGVWRMEGDCLRMELSDGTGSSVSGSFPVQLDPSGDYLYIEQDRNTGVCPPFFGEERICMDLIRSYG